MDDRRYIVYYGYKGEIIKASFWTLKSAKEFYEKMREVVDVCELWYCPNPSNRDMQQYNRKLAGG